MRRTAVLMFWTVGRIPESGWRGCRPTGRVVELQNLIWSSRPACIGLPRCMNLLPMLSK